MDSRQELKDLMLSFGLTEQEAEDMLKDIDSCSLEDVILPDEV